MDEDVQPDPARADRHAEPHQVGVLSVGARTASRGRWYYQNEWSAYTRRRVQRHLPEFDSHGEFVQFSIEAARMRNIPPPNASKKTATQEFLWDEVRIERSLQGLLRGRTARSLTLQFFNAAVDELEGLVWTTARVAEALQEEPDVPVTVAPPALEAGDEDIDMVALRLRYIAMLISKAEQHEGIPPEDLLDRIERIVL